jgi:radical SAM superfamily enzyme YgiQ (UPF0313 family)
MNIALVYPNVSVQERYGADIGEIGGKQAPLGLMYLSSFLKRHHHNVILIDAVAEGLSDNEILRRIKLHGTSLLGISSTTLALRNSQILAKKVKDATSIIVVLGGAHISSSPGDFPQLPCFDFAICGEGEISLNALAEKLNNGKDDFGKIGGLLWRRKGENIVNPRSQAISSLDELPFPDRDSLSRIDLYRPPISCYLREPVVSMMTSRGCPYQCIFCDKAVFGSQIRFFSADYVISEMKEIIVKYGAREIAFVDDTLPCNRTRFVEILEKILEEKLRIPWTCMANANDLDEELVKLMRRAGCWQIAIGIESGNDEILRLIRKKSDISRIAKIAKSAHDVGIYVKGFFMLGHPGESLKTIEETRKFALSLPLTDVTCTIATPIKGSEFYRMAESGEYGILRKDIDLSKFNYWEPVFIAKGLDAKTLLREQRKFFISFYLRAGVILKQVKKIRSITVAIRLVKTIFKIVAVKKDNEKS